MKTDGKVKRSVVPYCVKDSGSSVDDVFQMVNRAVFQGHGPDCRQRGGVVGVMVDPIHHYERLIRDLYKIKGLVCLTFEQILGEPCPNNEMRCAIRHDVDIDVRTALVMAEIEQRYGAKTSYFILHTSPYYGEFKNGIFYRHESMIHVYKRLQDLGHEIALHTDPLLLYQEYGINGAEAVEEEIRWLRSNGIKLVGTTAHNSFGVYGAENFAIFKGRPQRISGNAEDCPSEVIHNGKWAPLGVLDEKKIGLSYEANDIFMQDKVSVKYAATRSLNRWRWQSETSTPILRNPESKKPENCFISQDSLIDRVSEIAGGDYLVLVVHPVYYGCRHTVNTGPAMTMSMSNIEINRDIGWETYERETIQARYAEHDGTQEFQAMIQSNELGMLDFPLPLTTETDLFRIALFGGTNINAASVGVPAQLHNLLSEKLNSQEKGKVHISKFTFPGMGISRYFSWYKATKGSYSANSVILAIGADEAVASLPEYWADQSGYRKLFPPGDYLTTDGNTVETIVSSPGASIRRRSPRQIERMVSFCQSASEWPSLQVFENAEQRVGMLLRYCIEMVRKDGVEPLLLIQECGESIGLWGENSTHLQNSQGYSCFMAWLKKQIGDLGVNVIDPYSEFLNLPSQRPCHWLSVPEWNCRGHEIAAEKAFQAFSDILTLGEVG